MGKRHLVDSVWLHDVHRKKSTDTNRREKNEGPSLTLIILVLSILTIYVGCSKIYLFAFILMTGIVRETNLRKRPWWGSFYAFFDLNEADDYMNEWYFIRIVLSINMYISTMINIESWNERIGKWSETKIIPCWIVVVLWQTKKIEKKRGYIQLNFGCKREAWPQLHGWLISRESALSFEVMIMLFQHFFSSSNNFRFYHLLDLI